MKWPKRDKRPQSGRKSFITFDWLSPFVIQKVKDGIKYLESLQDEQGYDADYYKGEGFIIPSTALAKGLQYYNLALRMYGNANTPGEWTDMLGLLMPTIIKVRDSSSLPTHWQKVCNTTTLP